MKRNKKPMPNTLFYTVIDDPVVPNLTIEEIEKIGKACIQADAYLNLNRIRKILPPLD